MKIGYFLFLILACSCVPTKETVKELIAKEDAIKMVETKLVALYGREVLNERPFVALLKDDIWEIQGTFHCPQKSTCAGGVSHISLSARDGKILSYSHDK
jgi:hypothetical protein